MKTFIVILFSIISFSICAQQNLDIGAPAESGGNYGSINYVDMSSLGKKKIENFSYTDISGSPFWNDSWNTALLFLNNKNAVKVEKAKLNLYNGEVHFINKSNVELVAENDYIKK